MENLEITLETVLALFGGLAIVAGGGKAIISLFSPFRTLRAQVEAMEGKLRNDHERLTREEAGTKAILKALAALLDHGITGNHTGEMKKVRSDLNEFLMER